MIMKRLRYYLKVARYNIRKNKLYSVFMVLETMLTFIFVTILLSCVWDIVNDESPMGNASYSLLLQDFDTDRITGIQSLSPIDAESLMRNFDSDIVLSSRYSEYNTFAINQSLITEYIGYVNAGFWKVHDFNFIEGRGFSDDEYSGNIPVAVVNESVAEKYFRHVENAIGGKIYLKGKSYDIIGVTDDYQSISTGFNDMVFILDRGAITASYACCNEVMFPADYDMIHAKDQIAYALAAFYGTEGMSVDLIGEDILTTREYVQKSFGGNLFSFGIAAIVFILLLIPALNIYAMSYAKINDKAREIAIQKMFGATVKETFIQIIAESFILVFIGFLLAIAVTPYAAEVIENVIMDSMIADISLVGKLNTKVIMIAIFPCTLLFTILSNGLPAYFIAKRNIYETLKKN